MSDDKTTPPTGPPRACERCGEILQSALHLPERVGQPAYEIFRCVACGFIDWVAQGPEKQA